MTAPRCELLDWDTAFFGFRIAKVVGRIRTEYDVANVFAWCAAERIRCLYYLAASDDVQVLYTANKHAFSIVDVRITLECAPKVSDSESRRVRGYENQDLESLLAIARSVHNDSRFYYDSAFPRERCSELYARWIEKSVHAVDQSIFVGEQNGRAAGYITCRVDGNIGQIGLLGIAAWAQRIGLGTELLKRALSYFNDAGVETVEVVTQGRNIAAQRLYQRGGFVTRSAEFWFHRWFQAR